MKALMRDDRSQLLLQLDIPKPYDYGTWIRHDGVESACNRLALWSVHGGSLWLTSDSACGKSHLLRTFTREQATFDLIDVAVAESGNSWQLAQQWSRQLEHSRGWLFDVPGGAMPVSTAHALFHMIERARDLQRPLVIAWRGQVETLPPELSSRLLAMEKVQMFAPAADEDLLQILRAGAGALQWDIREQVLQAMLTYLPRDLAVLAPALQELERRSFEEKHKPGAAWVKQQLTRMAQEAQPRLV